jgi:hypothetical protein
VKKEYQTTGTNILIGHSLSGLFAVEALLDPSMPFSRVVAISPTLGWQNQELVRRLAAAMPSIKGRVRTNGAGRLPAQGRRHLIHVQALHRLRSLDHRATGALRWASAHRSLNPRQAGTGWGTSFGNFLMSPSRTVFPGGMVGLGGGGSFCSRTVVTFHSFPVGTMRTL